MSTNRGFYDEIDDAIAFLRQVINKYGLDSRIGIGNKWVLSGKNGFVSNYSEADEKSGKIHTLLSFEWNGTTFAPASAELSDKAKVRITNTKVMSELQMALVDALQRLSAIVQRNIGWNSCTCMVCFGHSRREMIVADETLHIVKFNVR